MNCPKCNSELEIFPRNGKELYICPECLCALLPDESSIKILKHFCTQEIIQQLILNLIDDSLFDNMKAILSAEKNLPCPKCKGYMQPYDLSKKLRFNVDKCFNCGSLWLNTMQMPLVTTAFAKNDPDDLDFKKTIDTIYESLARKKSRNIRSFDEIIAPFAVMAGILPAIPVGDNISTKTASLATRAIIIACTVVFILQIASGEILTYFSLIADKVVNQKEWYRLITHAFLHGGILHLLGNMFFLRIFGRTVENEVGWKKYLALFGIGAIVSGIFFIATSAKKDIPCVGASGAISAIIGAYLILFPKAKLRFDIYRPLSPYLPIPIQKITTTQISSSLYILSWIIMNLIFSFLSSGGKTTGIAYWGHIGGFVTGIVFIEACKNLRRG
ncbi:MAG: rhomboid family intramembrane serine protease [Candidatus Omnitrophota bacterium]|jgi:hypothetical protein